MKNILIPLLTLSLWTGGITAAEFTSERQIKKKRASANCTSIAY